MRDHATSSGSTNASADAPGALGVLNRREEALRNGSGDFSCEGLQEDTASRTAAEFPRLPVPHMYSA
jgi:hypothetical protein